MLPIFKYPAFGLWIAVSFFTACKEDDAPAPVTDIFYKSMASLKMEVAYEQGAEPYAMSSSGDNVWKFTELNIESLFVQRPVALDVMVPSGLNEMTALPDQNKTGFTVDNILELADQYRISAGNETDGSIFILFLDGYYKKDDALQMNVMGIQITGTTVVAVFKPLITALRGALVVREYAEQSVVIHEIGHAIGLVNNGLPLASSHHDSQHEAHCTNTDCVMYWENEGSNISSFVQNYFGNNKKLIFGEECVADVTEYMP